MARENNYDVVRENWRRRFLEMDAESLARRFGLKLDAEWLYIPYFSLPFGISRSNGEVVRFDRPEQKVGFDTAIMFYNAFHYAVEQPVPSGKMVPFREVRRAAPFEAAYRRTILARVQERFSGRIEELRRACEALRGRPVPQGDVGYALETLPGLEIVLTFWDGDDEFPAQANILFDSNVTDFMHEENVVCLAADAVHYLTEVLDGEDAVRVYSGS